MVRRLVGSVALAVLVVAPPAQAQVEGTWTGVLRVAGIELGVVIRFAQSDSGLQGLLDVPAQGQSGLPLTDISFTPPAISFLRMTAVGTLTFDGRLDGDSITGRIAQSGVEGTFGLVRGEATATRDEAAVTARARPDLERTFLEPCTVSGVSNSVYCGRYRVPEDRAAGSGRTIDLNVVVLPAAGERDPAAGPVVFLAGGPGGAATQLAPAAGVLFPDLRRSFDILLVDQRGTGESNPLQCTFRDFDRLARAMLLLDMSAEDVTSCRDGLDADLRLYTTPLAMDDLDDIRAALGYERLNLFGMSYGTRAALVYARRHPQHVRTMTLQGVAPTTRRLPVGLATDAQAALDATLRACAEDSDCLTSYGDVSRTLRAVLERLRSRPVPVEMDSSASRWSGTLRIDDGVFAGGLRLMLYTGQGGARIPNVVSSAARGDLRPLVEAVRPFLDNLGSTLAFGDFLSVTCAEDLPGADIEAEIAASRGTVLGGRAARNHARLCKQWPQGSVPPGYHMPVRSDAPTLLLSGSVDPITPERYAWDAAVYLSKSLLLTVPNAGHADVVASCEGRVVSAFIAAGTTEGLDVECVVPRPRSFPAPAHSGG